MGVWPGEGGVSPWKWCMRKQKKKKRNKGEGGSLMTRSTRALINQLDESPQKHAALQMFMVQAGCINPLETIKFLL